MTADAPTPPPPPPPIEPTTPQTAFPPSTPAPTPPPKKKLAAAPIAIVVGVLAAIGGYLVVAKATDKPAPTADQVAASFVPIEGFTYQEMPAGTLQPLEDAFASQPGAADAVAHFDARQLLDGGEPVAVVFVLSIDPDEMKGEFESSYVTGFTATSQATVEDVQVGDTTGHIAETPMGTIAFFFDADGYAFNVVGRDSPTVTEIAEGLEAGNS
jgi:hypothetical protein